jgi:serine/threonine protein kinase
MYEEIINSAAKSLGDTLTKQVAKGGHSTVYFGEKYVYKITEKKVVEKSERIHSLISKSDSKILKGLVPKTVLNKALEHSSLVVEELKHGKHPEKIDSKLLKEIVTVLSLAHKTDIEQVLTDFEGDSIPALKYWDNQVESAKQYATKLEGSVSLSEEDTALIKSCVEVVEEIYSRAIEVPKLVLVYKDVHKHNTLIDKDGELSALIDWGSAMSGPVELEHVVLWARFKDLWPQIQKELDIKLNKDLFVVSGIVQGLRFWKSFTKDSRYVDEQRVSLKRLLSINNSKLDNWESKLLI